MQKDVQTAKIASPIGESGRGRPREFDREAALAHATRLFWSKGYEGTSIANLTKAMGIAAPSLYAAFGSKEALYAEAIRHYGETEEPLFWAGFHAAATARDAVRWLLLDTGAKLSAPRDGRLNGCMVALSSVGGAGQEQLGELLKSMRVGGLERLRKRFEQAVADGEISDAIDRDALALFVLTVQGGMSVLARDGVSRGDLEKVAEMTMEGWDARVGGARDDDRRPKKAATKGKRLPAAPQ